MGRMYTVETDSITLDEDRDLWEVLAGTGVPVRIHGFHLFQTSDVADAAEEIVRLEEVRGVGSVTSGSGGASGTIVPIDDQDPAADATVETNNTTRMAAGTGSLENGASMGWNIRIPLMHWYTPETRPRVNPGDRWTMGILAAALADAVTFGSTLWLEEI